MCSLGHKYFSMRQLKIKFIVILDGENEKEPGIVNKEMDNGTEMMTTMTMHD